MSASSRHTGWYFNQDDSRLDFYYRGTRIGHIDGSNFVLASGITMDLSSITALTLATNLIATAGSVTAAAIADDSLTGDQVAEVAEDNTEGGVPLLYITDLAAVSGASADEDIIVVDRIRVVDAWAYHTAGAGVATDTIQLFNGASAISDALSWSGADTAIVRAAEINDANEEVAAAGTLRWTITNDSTGEATGAGKAFVLAVKVST